VFCRNVPCSVWTPLPFRLLSTHRISSAIVQFDPPSKEDYKAVCETSDPSNNDGDIRIGTYSVISVVFLAVQPYFLFESLPLTVSLLHWSRSIQHLKSSAGTVRHIIMTDINELVSVLWYHGVFCADPISCSTTFHSPYLFRYSPV
jgi:hypothetical protein